MTPEDHHSVVSLKYRADIDGLRAVAVLLVVFFHAFPKSVRGGFIGVDVFFVISGYLISTIIVGQLQSSTFSFVEFYSRRIKRIFPALILILITSYIAGWFVLFTDEYKQLGKHIAGGSSFVSNFVLWNESGYFDNDADTKPLLHLWSLGIEEQFYILWPLLLQMAWKLRWNLLKVIIGIGAVSFALNISEVSDDPVAMFYSPQTRFWELAVGSILAYITLYKQEWIAKSDHILEKLIEILFPARENWAKRPTPCSLQAAAGMMLIIAGVVTINKNSAFPGWWAMLPTLGAALIIAAGSQAWLNRVVLSNRALVWVGLISFPLYLWHWPLLSFAHIMDGENLAKGTRFAAVLASIALSWLTYRLVEKPIRFGGYGHVKSMALLIVMAVVGIMGYQCSKNEQLYSRPYEAQFQGYTKTMVRDARQAECFEIPFAYKKQDHWFCNLGNNDLPPSIFAYGDSHALSLLPAIGKYATENNVNILFTGTSGCPPLLGIQSMRGKVDTDKNNCQKLNERIFDFVKNNHIRSVILMGRWTYYTGGTTKPNDLNFIATDIEQLLTLDSSRAAFEYGIKRTLQKYKEIGVKVYFVEDAPQQLADPKDIIRKSRLSGANDESINRFSVSAEEHHRNNAWVSSLFKTIKGDVAGIINFENILCHDDICPLARDGKFLYFDDNHLSVDGALLIYPGLRDALQAK